MSTTESVVVGWRAQASGCSSKTANRNLSTSQPFNSEAHPAQPILSCSVLSNVKRIGKILIKKILQKRKITYQSDPNGFSLRRLNETRAGWRRPVHWGLAPRANFMSPSKEGKFHLVKSLQTLGEIFARWKKSRRKEEFLQEEKCYFMGKIWLGGISPSWNLYSIDP